MAEWLDLVLKYGNLGIGMGAIYIGWRIKGWLDRQESFLQNYPPHRHINGSKIVYPKEYQPSPIERLDVNA